MGQDLDYSRGGQIGKGRWKSQTPHQSERSWKWKTRITMAQHGDGEEQHIVENKE
jgi:hypothetical protein